MWYEILKFEITYRARRADTYIYFALLFCCSLFAVDFIFANELGAVKRNAPIVIAKSMGIMTAFFALLTSMIMGTAILRDFQQQTTALIFTKPITERDYFLGRFLGAWLILVLVFFALPLGMMMGDMLPFRSSDTLLPFAGWQYMQAFFYLVLPTLFFTGALFFVGGALSRKLMVVYTQGIVLLLLYILTLQLMRRTDSLFWSALLDPFSFQATKIITQFWTTTESNSLSLPSGGVLLWNRLLWLALGVLILLIGNYIFSFKAANGKKLKKQLEPNESSVSLEMEGDVPCATLPEKKSTIWQLWHHAVFHFKAILKEGPFWVIVGCAMAIIFTNSIGLGTVHGVDSYPTTYIVADELQEMSVFFFLMIMIFYSGELIWKERDVRLNGIHDALPVSDFTHIVGKFLALLFTYLILLSAMIVAGVIFQTVNGYYHYEWAVYFTYFFVGTFPFFFLFTGAAFFFHVLANHKFVGHALVVFLFVGTIYLRKGLGIDHGLLLFGAGDLGIYSAMNGYGHFLTPYLWFKLYWVAFALLLLLVAVLFSVRGTNSSIVKRWLASKQRMNKSLLQFGGLALLLFISSGSYIFYNTNILNTYTSPSAEATHRANYEKVIKKYIDLPQPQIVAVNLAIDLFPEERNYVAEGYFLLANKTKNPIIEVHIQTLPNPQVALDYLELSVPTMLDDEYEAYNYHIYTLQEALLPGDSIKMTFKQNFTSKGFTENSDANIIENGTFFNNFHFPTLGYNEYIEMLDDRTRAEHNLPPKVRSAKIDDPQATLQGLNQGSGEEIRFEMIISTDSSQIALAPGRLEKKWGKGDRTYFHYQLDEPIANFYPIVSARYQIMRDQWIPSHDSLGRTVDLEIYYHQGHEYNLERMMKGMKKSLDYYSKNFSPYPYEQLRIMEAPRYKNRAQAFPGTVPFSEGIGFIMDISEEDVDMAFFVTAHEVAHQWWGLHVNPANVEGKAMVTEALAQYSALMVLKEEYPAAMVQRVLAEQRESYLKGRTAEHQEERPLALVVSGQQYIHYGKGMANLYALQDYITEDSLNLALRHFIRDWNSFGGLRKKERYPTTADLLSYFKTVTPDSLNYLIEDLFETITFYDNKVTAASYELAPTHEYQLSLTVETHKYRVDSAGEEELLAHKGWVDIGVYALGPKGEEQLVYLEKHQLTKPVMELNILVDQPPTRVGIDPLFKLIDRNVEDNVVKLTAY